MKKLTTLIIAVFIISMASESFAQRFAVIGGMNLSNQLWKSDDEKLSDEFKLKPGFHVGILIQAPKSGLVSFEGGIILSTKGFVTKTEETYMGDKYTSKFSMNLYYLDIPLMVKFSFEVGEVIIFFETGPYIGIGLSGNMKSRITYQGEEETDKENIEWGSDDDDWFKRLDYGATFGVGVVLFEALQLGVHHDLGLANISSYTDDGALIKNRVYRFTVGYRFGK